MITIRRKWHEDERRKRESQWAVHILWGAHRSAGWDRRPTEWNTLSRGEIGIERMGGGIKQSWTTSPHEACKSETEGTAIPWGGTQSHGKSWVDNDVKDRESNECRYQIHSLSKKDSILFLNSDKLLA